jgi:NAD(P)-dependent dehydrogenase (short-subunit alcohol dehydrogenase family)
MAKAALNMLTRTCAEELAKNHRIYMNSVDTGWINDENPLHKASQIAKNNQFQTPIDEIDAAARILDPIYTSIMQQKEKRYSQNNKNVKDGASPSSCPAANDEKECDSSLEILYGKFLKDYKESEW